MEITQKEVMGLVKQFTGQANVLITPRAFVEFTGDHVAAMVLNQVIYWSERTQDKEGWFYKSGDEWEEELALSRYQVGRAVQKLKEFGVEVKLKKANGAPTLHYRLDNELFSNSFFKFLQNGKSRNLKMENQESVKSDFEETSNSLTEITHEITPKITAAAAPEPATTPDKKSESKQPNQLPRRPNRSEFDLIADYFAGLIETDKDRLSNLDYQDIRRLVDEGFTLERCKPGIDDAVLGIRSRPGGVVRNFRVCEKAIRQLDPEKVKSSVISFPSPGQLRQKTQAELDNEADQRRYLEKRKQEMPWLFENQPYQKTAAAPA